MIRYEFMRTPGPGAVHWCSPGCTCWRQAPAGSPLPVITNEEAVAAQRYDQELIALSCAQKAKLDADWDDLFSRIDHG